MSEQGAYARPAPVTVSLGYSNVVVTVAVFGFLCWVVYGGVHGGLGAENTSSRALSFGIAALFAVPLLMMLATAPRLLAPRRLTVDVTGLTISHGRRSVTLPWHLVHAIGIGYQQAPEEKTRIPLTPDQVKELVSRVASDRVESALQISGKQKFILEILPNSPDAEQHFPLLKAFWKAAPPPVPGLPPFGWRFPLPPVMSIAASTAQAVALWVPHAWLGWFERPWSG